MIHGGLRYLETYQFRLVREALHEREVLLRIAPHIIRPMRFVLPHVSSMRPKWMLNLGLFLYDRLGGRTRLPKSGRLNFSHGREGRPLKTDYLNGFHYADAVVEDARLVVLNAMDAVAKGASVRTHTKVESVWFEKGEWHVSLVPWRGGTPETVRARAIVNAAGPWVGEVLRMAKPETRRIPVKLVKGSHLVVPRIYEGDWAYLCQNDDGRVVFFWPYERDFTLIGTTDVPYTGDPQRVECSDEEVAYLLRVAERYFKHAPNSLSIVQKFAGVRPLYNDGHANPKDITRDYMLKLEEAPAPLLNIFGGKITTYRRLAESALEKLRPHFPKMGEAWTATATLPGGDLGGDFAAFIEATGKTYPWLEFHLLRRWCRLYGTRIHTIIGDAKDTAGLGREIVPGLYENELRYLKREEMAVTAEDILWRRTHIGLRLGRAEVDRLNEWLANGH